MLQCTQLAEHLNISSQAVSKWENETAYPDITLIPKIAALFEVSTDHLFGINENIDNERTREITALYNKLCKAGDNAARVELMREALCEYPHNYDFMNKLARSLYRTSTDENTMDEVISLCKTIILNSRDELIRCSAIQTAARAYKEKGMDDEAVEYINRLPSGVSCKEFYISEFLPMNERKKQLQENIFFLTLDKFVNCKEEVKYTSKLLDCVVANPDGVSKHWTGSHRQKLAAQMTEWEEFKPIRERKEYKELLDRLIS